MDAKEIMEILDSGTPAVVFEDMTDAEYNDQDWSHGGKRFWRSSEFKHIDSYESFFASLVTPKAPFPDNTLKTFNLGHYAEHVIAYNEPHPSAIVFDEADRPEPLKDFRNSANKAWRASLLKDAAPNWVFSKEDIRFMTDAYWTPQVKALVDKMRDSQKQLTIFWAEDVELEDVGHVRVYLRTRLDFYRESTGAIVDNKTTKASTFKQFRYSVDDSGYRQQAQQQMRGIRKAGKAMGAYYWFAQSKAWPFRAFVVEYTAKSQAEDAHIYRNSIDFAAMFEAGKEPETLDFYTI